jgi:hypothetical protein
MSDNVLGNSIVVNSISILIKKSVKKNYIKFSCKMEILPKAVAGKKAVKRVLAASLFSSK